MYQYHLCRTSAQKLKKAYPQLDPAGLCQALQISLYPHTDFRDLKGMFAMVLGRPCIFYNANLSLQEQKLVLAHELGHYSLHQEVLLSSNVFLDHSIFTPLSRLEREANLFAAELLIEDSELVTLVEEGKTVSEIGASLGLDPNIVIYKAELLKDMGMPLQLPGPPDSVFLAKREPI